MRTLHRPLVLLTLLLAATFASVAQTPEPTAAPSPSTGKPPIIIVPGLTGSELVNSKTGEVAWFKAGRAKDDDLRLPVSPNLSRNRDNLVPRDIIRSVQLIKFLPDVEIYERLIEALEKRGGYKEGKWDAPPKDGHQDTFYVFPYDWRRDNVESAQLLIRRIEALKRKLGKPDLKFNIIAHSMGGLITRYAAMYGGAPLSSGTPKPTWAGARHMDKVFLLGTPNEGSVLTLNSLLNGFSYVGGGINLPFVQNIDRFDVFTIPSVYQLLPHNGTTIAYDEKLNPLKLDIYDPKTWETYNWAIWQDDDFKKKLTPLEQRNARPFMRAALARARNFQNALYANGNGAVPVKFYLMGADCKDTVNAIVLVRDEKKGRWRTLFKADSYETADGTKVTSDQLKKVIYAVGDGVVPKRSLALESKVDRDGRFILPVADQIYQCEDHNRLVTNPAIQDKLFQALGIAATALVK